MAKPAPGDSAFEVEWWPDNAKARRIMADPDHDLSTLDSEVRYFPSKGLAIGFAKRVARRSIFASAMVRAVTFSRYGFWEHGDTSIVEVTMNTNTGAVEVFNG